MEIRVAEPHGMCSGVARALRIADKTLADHPGETLWCFHEIVHNEHVVAALRARGARFVDNLETIPAGARVLFSAHGVSPAVRRLAARRQLEVVDATCPFVAKVHEEARTFAGNGIAVALIGHKGHDEVVGIVGEAEEAITIIESPDDVRALRTAAPELTELAVLSQTTISGEMYADCLAALEAAGFTLRFPEKQDICYATRERQDAVRALAGEVDHVIVLGSRNSSNSKRLAEVARTAGAAASLIASPDELAGLQLPATVQTVGVTSGASTPEHLFEALCARLRA